MKVANDPALLPIPNHPIPNPNPFAPNPGFTEDQQQDRINALLPAPNDPIPNPNPCDHRPGLTEDQPLGRIIVTNDRGQAIRRSRRIMQI